MEDLLISDDINNILILEDDSSYQFLYKEILGVKYQLNLVDSIAKFQTISNDKEQNKNFDLAILDARLPDGVLYNYFKSGLKSDIPFIVVSSIEDMDILRFFFDNGAIDYIVKPFNKAELQIKIERFFQVLETKASEGELQVFLDSIKPDLTFKEYSILTLIINAEDNITDKEEIKKTVWKNISVTPKTLDVHLYNLRKKVRKYTYDLETISLNPFRLKLVNKS